MNNLLTDSFDIPRTENLRDNDNEMKGNVGMNSAEVTLKGFFKQANDIEKQIEKLAKLLKKLQDANEEYKALTKASIMRAIRQQMAKDIDEVGKVAVLAKSKIEELDQDNIANRQKPGCGMGSGVDRSRTATTVSLKKKYREKMNEFQTLRNTIHQDHRELVERKGRVYTGTSSKAKDTAI